MRYKKPNTTFHKRVSSDNLPYHVNDKNLSLDLKGVNLILIGERHLNQDDADLIMKLAKKSNAKYILIEALADITLPDMESKFKASLIDDADLHNGALTKFWIMRSMEINIPFIGIDRTDLDYDKLSVKEQFKIREAHFIEKLEHYRHKGMVIASVGDTHLRSIATEQLGPVSPLYEKYINDQKAVIVRSAEGEIE